MATAHISNTDAKSDVESFHVSIRRTFVHLETNPSGTGGAQRRVTRSLPPVLRENNETPDVEEEIIFFDPSPLKRDSTTSVSTAWELSTASDVSSEHGDGSSDAGRQSVTTGSEVSSPTNERQDKPRLSVAAKIYVPTSPPALSPHTSEHCKFTPQVQAAVEAAQMALFQTGLILTLTAHTVVQGWSVVISIRPEHFAYRERILSCAKQALLQAAEQSESIYVLGYCSRPFVLTPLGFKAQFAGMEDESAACWGVFAKGSCWKGSCCTWQHPTFISDVSVSLLLDCQGVQQQ